ncbi:MAG: beta-lactamase family protein [Oscillibacter sp.]|nr:beta-lactamase family protein [Oscillibacter sp.]
MNLYKKLGALLLTLALSLSLTVPALAAEETKDLETAAQEAAAAALTYGSATQVAWALWKDGEIITSGGQAAPAAQGQPMQPAKGSVYGIGSVSKIYTTVAAMQLAEAGKLDLDQPVVKYLPAFRMADPRYKDITVRMLLNHSSGLMGSSMGSGLLFGDPSEIAADQLLDRLAAQRLKADPGAFSVYCNDGFTLAQLVVEAVSGMEFLDYLDAKIFTPAGLDKTWAPAGVPEQDRAPIYQPGESRPLPIECLGLLGTGGLYATAEDLAAFGGALTDETLLKQSSLDAMAAPEYAKGFWPQAETPDALAYGLGWDNVAWYPFAQNDILALVKGGDTGYYHAGLVILPEHGMAAAVLSSGGVSTYNEMAASQLLIAALAEEGVTVDQTPLTLPAAKPAEMPEELLDHAGFYGSIYAYQVDITSNGKLTMSYADMPDVPPQTFTYSDDGTFRDAEGTAFLRFEKSPSGDLYLYQQVFSQLPGLGGLPTANYAAMKLPENNITPELQAHWKDILSTSILPLNERYSSQLYLSLAALSVTEEDLENSKTIPGYSGALRIEDENHLRYVVKIPGNVGRDGSDLEARRDENGVLRLYQSNGAVYMEEKAVPVLSTGQDNASACTIQPDGYARWYRVGDAAAGKTMTVDFPENAGFWVYDSHSQLLASSVLWDSRSVELPEDSLVVFAGDPGARFSLQFQ